MTYKTLAYLILGHTYYNHTHRQIIRAVAAIADLDNNRIHFDNELDKDRIHPSNHELMTR